MKFGTVDIPNSLLDDLHNNKVVVFAGAGVSMGEPAGLPNFESLTKIIAKATVYAKSESENLEQFLGRLDDRGVEVHHLAKTELSREGAKPTPLHRELLKLYRKDQSIRLVTTNFDLLFEQAAKEMSGNTPEVFHAPMLPFGHQLNGIIHLHGSICYPDQMVLTDRDFGRAYLREAWATRFLLDLYDKYTFLFIGYSHSDTVMNYLVRSLPPKAHSSHYALIADSKDADHQHWGSLEIEMIPYPQHENDHSELDKVISKLANHVQRGMVGWHREISAIAEKHPHELNEEEKGLIDYALTDKTKTEFFTKSASHPEWIDWFDKRGHLTPLFDNGQLRDNDRILSWWLVDQYLENHSHLIFLLIGRHPTRVHPRFWDHIARKVGRDSESSWDKDILGRWISLLLSTAPGDGLTTNDTSNLLLFMGQRCIAHELLDSLLKIFDAMMQSRLLVRGGYSLPGGDENEENLLFNVELQLLGNHFELNELWEAGLKPNLSQVATPLLERAVKRLEEQYLTLCTWGKVHGAWDPMSEERSAIEPHEQDRHPQPVDVLIDVARDCLESLASNHEELAAQWCNRYVGSDVSLLRRLAVHGLSRRADLSPDDQIQWLLEQIDLHDPSLHHEVFQAVRHAYAKANPKWRKTLIKAVWAYHWRHEDCSDDRKFTARVHVDWFHWLHNSDPTCPMAKQALDKASSKYPNFEPEEQYPDLTHWIESGWVGPTSPWTPEELLSKPPSYWLDRLLSVEDAEREGPTRRGLIQSLSEATRRDFDWSLGLADTFGGTGQWDDYPWSALIDTWGQMELEEDQYLPVFTWLESTQLYPKHSRKIAEALYALVTKGGPSYAFQLLSRANQIAEELWKHLDRAVSIDIKHGWFNQSASSPVWGLANFWFSSVLLWRRHQDPAPTTLCEDYRRPLEEIIKDSSTIGGLGKSVLASKLDCLLTVDEEWTREHLLPLFEPDSADFQAAWDGFVATGRLSPPVAEALKEPFLNAVTRISTALCPQRRGFVECYTVMLIYVVDDVLDTWIPKLFEYGSHQGQPDNREPTLLLDDNSTIPEIFALKVTECLQQLSDSEKQELWQRWLKDYWQNRLYGRPAPLTANEANLMLDWLPELNTEFPEAVSLAIQMPLPSLQHTRILACLVTDKTWEHHPKAVAKLLIYLWKCNIPTHYIDTVPKIIAPLLESDISPERKQKLEDIRIQL